MPSIRDILPQPPWEGPPLPKVSGGREINYQDPFRLTRIGKPIKIIEVPRPAKIPEIPYPQPVVTPEVKPEPVPVPVRR